MGKLLRFASSLKLAVVLIVVLVVAMGAATVYESSHGTAQTQRYFYGARWFGALLCLLAASVTLRLARCFPFKRAQAGFVITHCALLVILLGALVTRWFAIDGRIALAAGESADQFTTDNAVLTVSLRDKPRKATCPADFDYARKTELTDRPFVQLDGVRVEIDRFLPDARAVQEVRNDGESECLAAQISLAQPGHEHPAWLFADEPAVQFGAVAAELRVIDDAAQLTNLLSPATQPAKPSMGQLTFELGAQPAIRIPVEPNVGTTRPLGDSGYEVRIVRYLPHAVVREGALTSASDKPVNPAVELEIIGAQGSQRRFAFARFPEFSSMPMHGGQHPDQIKIHYTGATIHYPSNRLEILVDPLNRLYARFVDRHGNSRSRGVTLGRAIDTPWMHPSLKLTVVGFFDRARVVERVEPVLPPRQNPWPAIHVVARRSDESQQGFPSSKRSARALPSKPSPGDGEVWLLRERPETLVVGGQPLRLEYGWRRRLLGFTIALQKFEIGTYPGTRRPRSFESHVVVEDPRQGLTMQRVISMNNPLQYKGFSLFQSSYESVEGTVVTFLQVSRDPGKWVAYAGYVLLLTGMVVVLGTRIARHRKRQQHDARPAEGIAI